MSDVSPFIGNITSHSYSSFNLVSSVFPIIGLLVIVTFVYVLIFYRNVITRLLLGYITFGVVALVLFVLNVMVRTLYAYRYTGFNYVSWIGSTFLSNLWIIPTLPLAYFVGRKVQDYMGE